MLSNLATRPTLLPGMATSFPPLILSHIQHSNKVRGLLEKYPTFGRETETGLLEALDT